jgi:RNA polymerase sigma-70 factor, ECF subfamily
MAVSREEDLARRLAAGEQAALEEAYRLYVIQCRATAYRVLQDETLAQDAVQEAFLSLWRHREGLVVRAAGVRPWLLVVTRNAALNMLRSARRRATRESGNPPETVDSIDPTDVAATNIEAADLRAAVMELPPDQRTVITMAYFARRTLAEIARQTGAPLGTVKRRAQLGLQRLGRIIGDKPS